MKTIALSAGHGKYIRGAAGSPRPPMLEEVDEARRVCTRVAEIIRANDTVMRGPFFDDTSTNQNTNLSTIVNWHNSQSRDLDVSVHFNSATFSGQPSTSNPVGHETLYVSQKGKELAVNVAPAVARAGGFINRGAKQRTDLYFLNNTNKPAVLLEVCFVNSSADADLYRRNFDAICIAIVETLAQITLSVPPVEPPVEPEPPPVGEVAHIDIQIAVKGSAVITINGQDFAFNEPGPEEPVTPLIKPNHQNIICTVFGGTSDPNDSAYPPYDFITDTERSVALPYKFAEPRPQVRVFNAENELSVLCQIRDVGPWLTDDAAYVLGNERPVAEPEGTIIPRGPNQGERSNGAGCDLTPAAAEAIKLKGKGIVHWMFEEEEPAVA